MKRRILYWFYRLKFWVQMELDPALKREEQAWEAHEDFIAKEFDLTEVKVNFGWMVDEVTGEIQSKVYGHGVVTTDMKTLETEYEAFEDR